MVDGKSALNAVKKHGDSSLFFIFVTDRSVIDADEIQTSDRAFAGRQVRGSNMSVLFHTETSVNAAVHSDR